MDKINKPIAAIVILFLTIWGMYTYGNRPGTVVEQQKAEESQEDKAEEKQPTVVRNETPTFSGWIPTWASIPGYSTVAAQKTLFTDIAPVWYEVKDDGSLIDKRPMNAPETVKLAKDNKIKLIPSIAMFDHEIFTNVLQNETNLSRHITQIHKLVVDNEYDGIDLDYESTKLTDKDKYFEFLTRLSEKMKADNKILVVTVLAKWGENITYPYLPQTRAVQDWKKIAELADEIRIMTYDYTSASALNPGPIAPLEWIQQVIDYAKTQAPADKFVLGVHLYSYERWVEVPDRTKDTGFDDSQLQFKGNYSDNTATRTSPARSYDYGVVQNILKNYPGQTEDFQGEKIYRYSKVNDQTGIYENRVLVYIDPTGVKDRLELVKANGLKGVTFWQLGNGDDLLKDLK